MNDTLRVIDERRSTRVYSEKEITNQEKKIILEAAINAPTAGNMVLYSIIDVCDQDKKERLSILCDNQPFIKNGKMVLLFVSDARKWYEEYNRINQSELKPSVADFYLSLADAHIAAENAVIAAESLGIGSCYIGDIIENYEEVKMMFKLPKYVNPVCLLIFGHKKNEVAGPKIKRFNLDDVVHIDEFSERSHQTFVNKFESLNDVGEQERKADQLVNAVFKHKMKAEFFQEMNRSFKLMLKEYLED